MVQLAPMCFVKSHAIARSGIPGEDNHIWRRCLVAFQRGPSVDDGSFPQRSSPTEVANVVFSLPTKSIGLFPLTAGKSGRYREAASSPEGQVPRTREPNR